MCTIKTDGAKKSAKPPRVRSLIKADKTLERNIKQSHYVAVMWENCVIGNPSQLNPCGYGWEINEGEKSLRPTLLPTETKMTPDKILQTASCKCISTQYKKTIIIINAAVSELDLTFQSSVIVNNVMIKVTCTGTIMKLRMKIMIVKAAQKMNNLLDMI